MLVEAARAAGDHAHALHRPALAAGLFLQQLLHARLQGRERGRQQAAAAAREQLLRGEQGVQLFGVEPQARQFEAIALGGVVLEAGLAVADHRRHQAVAEEGEVAVDGGARAAQLILQPRDGHRIARGLEEAVEGVDAFVAVHVRD